MKDERDLETMAYSPMQFKMNFSVSREMFAHTNRVGNPNAKLLSYQEKTLHYFECLKNDFFDHKDEEFDYLKQKLKKKDKQRVKLHREISQGDFIFFFDEIRDNPSLFEYNLGDKDERFKYCFLVLKAKKTRTTNNAIVETSKINRKKTRVIDLYIEVRIPWYKKLAL